MNWIQYNYIETTSTTNPTKNLGNEKWLQRTKIKYEIASDRSISYEKNQKERAATGRGREPPVGMTAWIWRKQRSLKETWADDSPNRLREWVGEAAPCRFPCWIEVIRASPHGICRETDGEVEKGGKSRARIVTASPPLSPLPFAVGPPVFGKATTWRDVTPIGFCAGGGRSVAGERGVRAELILDRTASWAVTHILNVKTPVCSNRPTGRSPVN